MERKQRVVLDPVSPLELTEYVLHLCDVVPVMTVNPGFGGQTLRSAPSVISIQSLKCGENIGTAGQVATGVAAVVAGSAIFGTKDYATATAAIRTNAIAASQS